MTAQFLPGDLLRVKAAVEYVSLHHADNFDFDLLSPQNNVHWESVSISERDVLIGLTTDMPDQNDNRFVYVLVSHTGKMGLIKSDYLEKV